MFQPSDHLCNVLLNLLCQFLVFPVLGSPELDTAPQMQPEATPVWWDLSPHPALSPVPCLPGPFVYCTTREWNMLMIFYSNGTKSLRVVYFRYPIFICKSCFLQWVFPTLLPHLPFTLPRNLGNAWSSCWWQVAILVPARGHTLVLAP